MVTGDVLFVGIGDDPKHADKEHLHEIFRFFFLYLSFLQVFATRFDFKNCIEKEDIYSHLTTKYGEIM